MRQSDLLMEASAVDDRATLHEAAKKVKVSPNAIWRWCRRGLKTRDGKTIFLEHRRVGGRIFTRWTWLEAFFAATTDMDLRHWQPSGEQSETTKSSEGQTNLPLRSRSKSPRRSAVFTADAENVAAGY